MVVTARNWSPEDPDGPGARRPELNGAQAGRTHERSAVRTGSWSEVCGEARGQRLTARRGGRLGARRGASRPKVPAGLRAALYVSGLVALGT
jgi:hypothetical protein